MYKKRVVIIQEGTFGAEHYATYIEILQRYLEGYKKRPSPGYVDVEPEQVATVEVVSSVQEAEDKAEAREVDILIFVSVEMLTVAKRIQATHPRLKVFVLAGTAPEVEPYVIPKCVLVNREAVQELLEA